MTDLTSDETVFDRNFKVQFTPSKFVQAAILLANINKAISDNIEQVLTSEEFRTSAADRRPKM